jgi:hypothetical protein
VGAAFLGRLVFAPRWVRELADLADLAGFRFFGSAFGFGLRLLLAMANAADVVARINADIAHTRVLLAAAQRDYSAFQKRPGAGTGFKSDAEYRRANELAGRVFDLKRSLKSLQKNKRSWSALAKRG